MNKDATTFDKLLFMLVVGAAFGKALFRFIFDKNIVAVILAVLILLTFKGL